MARGVNKVILVGNLGQDPEVRYTPDGKAVANMTVATSESWKDQSGQAQEKTEWHRVCIFGKLPLRGNPQCDWSCTYCRFFYHFLRFRIFGGR